MQPFLQASLCLVVAGQLMACGAGSGMSAQSAVRATQHGMARSAPADLPAGRATAEAPFETTFSVAVDGEGVLDLTASVPGGDWELVGREAATVRLFVDGQYNQDVVLAMGELAHTYRRALGAR